MTGATLLVLTLGLAGAFPLTIAQTGTPPGNEIIAAIRVHGNHTTPDEDVIRLAGVALGQPVTPTTVETVAAALRKSGRFRSVEVRKRFVSFDDPTAVLLVIIIEERIGIAVGEPTPGPMRRLKAGTMWLPVVNYEDGYGWTYGARFAFPDLLGRHTRIAIPLTWGGEREASLSVEHTFDRGPLTRIIVPAVCGAVKCRPTTHPRCEAAARSASSARSRRPCAPVSKRERSRCRMTPSRSATAPHRCRRPGRYAQGADVPAPGGLRASGSNWLWSGGTPIIRSPCRSARVPRSARAVRLRRPRPLSRCIGPVAAVGTAMLGGTASLRGFRLGYRYGDQLASVSAEIRHPLSSPLSLVKMGWAVFTDVGTTYAAHTSLADARFDQGVGGGIFLTAPVLSLRLDIATASPPELAGTYRSECASSRDYLTLRDRAPFTSTPNVGCSRVPEMLMGKTVPASFRAKSGSMTLRRRLL